VLSRVNGLPRLAAALGVITVLAACSSTAGTGSGSSAGAAKPLSASQTIRLAAFRAQRVDSWNSSISVTVNAAASGTVNMAGTMQEQVRPSLKAEVNFSTFSARGMTMPGGVDEIVTTQAAYVKMGMLTQALHSTKPWIEIPFSELSQASGLNLNSLFSQAQTNNPLVQTQMLTASSDVHQVGTGVIGGVPVTEYAGTYSLAKGLDKLPAADRGAMSSQLQNLGSTSAQFKVWLDGQQQLRKLVFTVKSSKLTETVTETIESINQPVSITTPAPNRPST